jgi:hypothetical protein
LELKEINGWCALWKIKEKNRKGYNKGCAISKKTRAMSEGQRRSWQFKEQRAAGNIGPKPTNVKPFAKRKN